MIVGGRVDILLLSRGSDGQTLGMRDTGGDLAYGRLSKINILADKPIPAERSEGPCEQSGLAAGGIAPGGMPPVDHPGGPWEIDFILIEPRNHLAFILFRAG